MKPVQLRSGGVLQSSIPRVPSIGRSTQGLLLRGVVTATYVSDDKDHPYSDSTPVAVYCDVLTYTQTGGSRYYFLKSCLVSQPTGGIQRGRVWKPRASTIDTSGNSMNIGQGSNPADLDGDHVLVGFIDGNANMPVILRGMPHPSADQGNSNLAVGQRTNLKLADGDPDFTKHHGSYFGISQTGDFVADTTLATDGSLQSNGADVAGTTDGSKGNHLFNMEQHSKRLLQLMDMSTPASPQAVVTELLELAGYTLDFLQQTPGFQVQAGANNTIALVGSGSSATCKIGDGTQHVAIVEHLQAFYSAALTGLKAVLDSHVHPTAMGPSGPAITGAPNTGIFPAWDNTINSSKVSLPDG